jgi:hypothetical protein
VSVSLGVFLCHHFIVTMKTPKNAELYTCKHCLFKCSKLSDYTRHTMTAKHNMMTNDDINDDNKTPKNAAALLQSQFICDCGKMYKYRQGLSVHRKKCLYEEPKNSMTTNEIPERLDPASVISLIKQNEEFKQLMVEQHTENLALQKKLVDAVKEGTVINNTTNNNTNNTQFNLNFFLNDTCKDAMNITDFLGNMNVNIDEIEYIGHHGYVNGMTKLIMDRLKGMDITKRPIHCTDIKRETMYIKDQNEWSKDTDELTKLRKILTRITMNNYRTVPQWKTAHPKSEEMDTRDYNFCYKMMRVILGDVEEAQIRLDNKIIKTMSKELFCK